MQEMLKNKGVNNEVVLLREKKIERCHGCVEFCNHQLKCRLHDDFDEIISKINEADGYIFALPNYFQLPPGIFKDFIDRFSIFFTKGSNEQFKKKKAVVICVGADEAEKTEVLTKIIANNFCNTIGLKVVGQKSFQSKSELKGNYNDIFENGLNPMIENDLKELIDLLVK
jgi:multimeric flavodoxin WrbA